MRRALFLLPLVVASCSGSTDAADPVTDSTVTEQDSADDTYSSPPPTGNIDTGAVDVAYDTPLPEEDTMPKTTPYVYVGCGNGDIEQYDFARASGTLTFKAKFAGGSNPSFLAVHPTTKYLYAVNEGSSQVAAFSIEAGTGKLALLNRVSSEGSGPAYVSVDPSGKYVLVANYGDGAIASLAIEADGKLGAKLSGHNPGDKAHAIVTHPSNKFVYVPTLSKDAVYQYAFEGGKLTPLSPVSAAVPSGAGPRHLAFAPDGAGKFAWVINELNDTVTAFAVADDGKLTAIHTVSTLPSGASGAGNTGADIHVLAGGKWLYASNRGHNSIAVFAVAGDGRISLQENVPTGGSTPRNFSIDGGTMLVANQSSGNVVTFAINDATGGLTKQKTTSTCGNPAFVTVIHVPS